MSEPSAEDRREATAAAPVIALDHLVLTAHDIATTVEWYPSILGMEAVSFSGGRTALAFGTQKINLHQAGREFEPKALAPTPGSGDLCFVTAAALEQVIAHLTRHNVPVVAGPGEHTGARGPLLSIYVRDPDGNLIEISNQRDSVAP